MMFFSYKDSNLSLQTTKYDPNLVQWVIGYGEPGLPEELKLKNCPLWDTYGREDAKNRQFQASDALMETFWHPKTSL
eukprot:1159242-Pelagomonas_calceolata.AAC.6